MKNIKILLLFGVINFISWNFLGVLFIVNILIIFYFIEFLKTKNWLITLNYSFALFIIFNISATFWLVKVDEFYGVYALLFNSSIMAIVFFISTYFSKKSKYNQYVFIFSWVLMEWLYSKWDMAWPWLNFGNVLSNQWYLIKWYSIVGTYGGSIWILFTGLFLYNIISKYELKNNTLALSLFFILPIYSVLNYYNHTILSTNKSEVLTYVPKCSSSNFYRTKSLFKFVKTHKTPNIILTSELFYSDLYPQEIKNGDISIYLDKIFKKNPKIVFFAGSEIDNSTKIKFNGVSVITKDNVFFRTKKKYVPITEFTTSILTPLFGNTYFSKNSIDDSDQILKANKTCPFVCYESVFPSFFAENTLNTKFVFLSTSEAFLKKSDFAKEQYLNIVRIRAIESGRYVLKCSYDGISCLINPNGGITRNLDTEFNNVTIPEITENTIFQKIISYL